MTENVTLSKLNITSVLATALCQWLATKPNANWPAFCHFSGLRLDMIDLLLHLFNIFQCLTRVKGFIDSQQEGLLLTLQLSLHVNMMCLSEAINRCLDERVTPPLI